MTVEASNSIRGDSTMRECEFAEPALKSRGAEPVLPAGELSETQAPGIVRWSQLWRSAESAPPQAVPDRPLSRARRALRTHGAELQVKSQTPTVCTCRCRPSSDVCFCAGFTFRN